MSTVPVPDPTPDDLREVLAWRAAPVYFYERVGSTNDVALDLARAGCVSGTAVLADLQEAGRGRLGRSWWSPPAAGMYLSVIVHTRDLGTHVPLLTLAAGVALSTALRELSGLPVELKWPNDLVIGRPWRKLAGILCEATTASVGVGPEAVVIGMGMNLHRSAYPPAIADRATSVAEECQQPVTRPALVSATLRALDQELDRLRRDDVEGLLRDWRALACAALAQAPVRWRDHEGEHRGTTVGLADDGALLVRRPGTMNEIRIVSGEVVWEMLTRD